MSYYPNKYLCLIGKISLWIMVLLPRYAQTQDTTAFHSPKTDLLKTDDDITQKYPIIDVHLLEERTARFLDQKSPYVPDLHIDYLIGLPIDSLPSLSDENIKDKMNEIPTNIDLRFNHTSAGIIRNLLIHHRKYIVLMLSRAEEYFPYIEDIIEERNLPYELKYIPIIESALNPKARSKAGAVGLWQIMRRTGQSLGLHINTLVDERLDPKASTRAALSYMEKLHHIYEDWLLTLAAYNVGPSKVNRAIKDMNGVSNYWAIRHLLPKETQKYIPLFIATVYVLQYANDYRLKPRTLQEKFLHTVYVPSEKRLTFRYISEQIGISEDDLRQINPSLTKDIVPSIEDGYAFNIYDYALADFEILDKNDPYLLSKEQSMLIPQNIIHQISHGDNLSYIAQRYGCSISDIKLWNKISSDQLKIGQKLLLKSVVDRNLRPEKAPSNSANKIGIEPQEKKSSCQCVYHEIKNGDTLWDISNRYKIPIQKIKKVNNIPDKWTLKLGVILEIPLQ